MAIWDRYKSRLTGFEVEAEVYGNFQSVAYCDHPQDGLYTAKPPFAKLKMTPATQLVNVAIDWDVSDSGSPTGTIDTYTLRFGSTPSDLVNQPWAGPKAGQVIYDTVGKWTASLTVRDLLAVDSQPDTVTVNIVDGPPGVTYLGTIDAGVHKYELATMTALNNGLTGGWLNVRDLRLHPATSSLPKEHHHLWIATIAGVAYSINGGSSWILFDNATLGAPDVPENGETAADMDSMGIDFNPTDINELTVLRKSTLGAGLWLYITTDYGDSWQNFKVEDGT